MLENVTAIELPFNDYFEYYGPDFKLHISPSNMAYQNTSDYLDKVKSKLFDNLRMLPHAPGVQMQGERSSTLFSIHCKLLFIYLVKFLVLFIYLL